MRILIIEDETALRKGLDRQLTTAGFHVDVAADGEEGLFAALERPLDAAIVDLGLPKLPGLEVIRQLRANRRTLPALVLTARNRWEDAVEVLEAGADDYVRKPFRFEEVLSRVQTLMRRNSGWTTAEFICEPIALHMRRQTVSVNGTPVDLTTFEYRILEHLMLHAGEIVSKTELSERLYGEGIEAEYNVINVLIARLRRKLDPEERIDPIVTVRGRGYRFQLARSCG